MSAKKYVYLFSEGRADMKALLGGKGANLAEMTNIGLPVPPGFTVTTEACIDFYNNGKEFPKGLKEQVIEKIKVLEKKTNKSFGDKNNPLLVSVRSGAVVSMPGMMDTVLNLGLNDETVIGLLENTKNPRFAYDCYRRFLQMFGDVVKGIEHYKFNTILEAKKAEKGVRYDYELDEEDLKQVVEQYKSLIKKETKEPFPQDPVEQLFQAIHAVFNSWNNDRAVVYRKIHKIPDNLGTAVNVQTMVFGNMGDDSGTGVSFTRNPSTGEKVLYGEYLTNAQGEDVVAGIRTPQPIEKLKQEMPKVYEEFVKICKLLEKHYRDMQDIEFTIERGRLWILQTRNGKRTAQAAIKIAIDMMEEGLISEEEAVMRVEPDQLSQLLHRRIDPNAKLDVIATGLPASPGAGCGEVVFDADLAEKLQKEGRKVVLVRTETTPDDIHGMVAAEGILTSRGGMTSHAAVVARGMGKPCICGCEDIKIDYANKLFRAGERIVKEGDYISIDGTTGKVILGKVPMIDPEVSGEFLKLLELADKIRNLSVRANADTPEDALKAKNFGAEGIGLTRTEHMFMQSDRLPVVQRMILAETIEERQKALDELLPMQQQDFYEILKVMEGLPVCIRLLDPPLHEFLPDIEELVVEITTLKLTGGDSEEIKSKETLLRKTRALSEFNPMLGHRGCRLGITYPEIYEMQAKAIFRATAQLVKEGYNVIPEVEIPLVVEAKELEMLKEKIMIVAEQVKKEAGVDFNYTVGTMIEIPRAALLAGEIAEHAAFFSFGTNDLTQTTFGFSRDDAEGKFMYHYIENKILKDNPFIVLDRKGVGRLMKIAIEEGRKTNSDLLVGICGEHGGEASSVEFCHMLGLNYVSCSPYRVPIARLAAAQAKLKSQGKKSEVSSV